MIPAEASPTDPTSAADHGHASLRQPHLEGERIALRPLRREDEGALYEAARDPEIWAQHPASKRYEEPVFREFFEDALRSGGALAVLERDTGRVIGSSRFVWLDEPTGRLEIGWTFLTRDHWGGATNGELKTLMIDHGLSFARKIVFFVGPSNLRSQRALEKIGAVRVGLGTNRDGSERLVFEITREAWGQTQRAASRPPSGT